MKQTLKDRNLKSDQGFAMMIVLGYVMAITILGSVFLSMTHRTLDVQQNSILRTKSLVLAESGILISAYTLLSNNSYKGTKDIPLGDGFVSVSVVRIDATQTWQIRSTGTMNQYLPTHQDVYLEVVIKRNGGGWSVIEWSELKYQEAHESEAS